MEYEKADGNKHGEHFFTFDGRPHDGTTDADGVAWYRREGHPSECPGWYWQPASEFVRNLRLFPTYGPYKSREAAIAHAAFVATMARERAKRETDIASRPVDSITVGDLIERLSAFPGTAVAYVVDSAFHDEHTTPDERAYTSALRLSLSTSGESLIIESVEPTGVEEHVPGSASDFVGDLAAEG